MRDRLGERVRRPRRAAVAEQRRGSRTCDASAGCTTAVASGRLGLGGVMDVSANQPARAAEPGVQLGPPGIRRSPRRRRPSGQPPPLPHHLQTTGVGWLTAAVVPEGRWRQTGKWVATALVALVAVAHLYLGVEAPTDILVGVAIGVAIPLLGFRWFAPSQVFPVTYRQGRSAHLDVGGARGQAIRRALQDQLGLVVDDVQPFGLAGSAGSTPLRIRVKGDPDTWLFAKLYAKSHLRADRWYKLGRELLYGRLEDEKPFNTVRRLVQQEDYALHKLYLAGLPTPRPYGVVELTPEREYLLVTEFFDGAIELGEADVDDQIIDDGLGIIRKLWDAGMAHRD